MRESDTPVRPWRAKRPRSSRSSAIHEGSGELRSDPSESLSSPRVEKYVPKAISEHQIQTAAARAGDGDAPPRALRDRAMLHMLYSTGMRVTELVSLDVDDVDLDARDGLLYRQAESAATMSI